MGSVSAWVRGGRHRVVAGAAAAMVLLATLALATRGGGGPQMPTVGPLQLVAAWHDGYNHFLVTVGGPDAPRPPGQASNSDPVLWEPGWPRQAYVANLEALEAQGGVVRVYTQAGGVERAVVLNQPSRLSQVSLMRAAMNTPAPPDLVWALAAHPGVHQVKWLTPGLASIETRHSIGWVRSLPGVTSVAPDRPLAVSGQVVAWPDNYLQGMQWDLRNTGQLAYDPQTGSWAPGTPGQDINPLPAWDQTLGQGTTVAVLDMGVAASAAGLAQVDANNIQQAPNYNFVTNQPGAAADMGDCSDPPTCDELHGTWVTSVVDSALDQPDAPLVGEAPGAQVLEEAVGTSGTVDIGDATSAIYYALDHGARVLNLSWGGDGQGMAQAMLPVQAAIQQAQADGALVVVAAGNYGQDNDPSNPNPLLNTNYDSFYPASFPDSNIISVGATTADGARAGFSNYGGNSVSLFAPGQGVLVSSSGGAQVMASGTSFAAPLVAAVAAQIWSLQPSWSYQQVKQVLMDTAQPDSQLEGLAQSPGVLDAGAALQAAAQGAMTTDFEGFGELQAGQLGQTQVQIQDPAAASATGPLDVRLALAMLDQGQPAAAGGIPVRWNDSAGSGVATTDAAGVVTFPAPAGVATGATLQLGLDLPWQGQWGVSVALVPASTPTSSVTLGARATLFDVGQVASSYLAPPPAAGSSPAPSGSPSGGSPSGGGGSTGTSPSSTSPTSTSPTSTAPSSPSSGSGGGGSGGGATSPPTSTSPTSTAPTSTSPTSPSSGGGSDGGLQVTPPSQQEPPSSPGASPTPVPNPTPVGNYPSSSTGGGGAGGTNTSFPTHTSTPTPSSGSSGGGGGSSSPTPSPTGVFGLESVQPSTVSTSGGSPVTIYGTKIPADAGVLIGGQPAQVLDENAPSSILVAAPPAQPGTYSVQVTSPAGESQTMPDAVTYQAPSSGSNTTSPSSGSGGGGSGGGATSPPTSTSPTSPSSGSPTSTAPSSPSSGSPTSTSPSSPSSGSGGGGSGGGATSSPISSGGGSSGGGGGDLPPPVQAAPASWSGTPSTPTLYPMPGTSQSDSDMAGAYAGEWVAYPPAGPTSSGFAV